MEKDEVAKKLASLAQLDIDAVHAYEQAIEKVDVAHVKEQLVKYKDDHDRHIRELSAVIRRLGGTPPDYSPDFKGFLISGFTSLRSITGTEGALKAMKTNEKLTNKNYKDATGWDLDPEARQIVDNAYGDEKNHLSYIEKTLDTEAWR